MTQKKRDWGAFCRRLSSLLLAGIGVLPALELLASEDEERAMIALARPLAQQIRDGVALSEALRRVTPAPVNLIALVMAGETSGNLAGALENLANLYEQQDDVTQAVRTAMIYPVILAISTLVTCYLLVGVVLPRFAALFTSLDRVPPLATRMVLAAGDVMAWGLPLLVIAGLVGFLILKQAMRQPLSRISIDATLLRLPIIGDISRLMASVTLARGVAALLEGGVSLVESLAIMADTLSNSQLRACVIQGQHAVEKGENLARVLRMQAIWPPRLIAYLAAGLETGRLAKCLNHAAQDCGRTLTHKTRRLAAIVTPAMTLLMAAMVGAVAVALIGALTDVYDIL